MLIAQITDTHIKMQGALAYKKVDTAAMLAQCVDTVKRLDVQPDVVVLTGDLTDFGDAEEYAYLRRILAPLSQRLIVVPGNHDEREGMRAAFADGGYLPAQGFLQFAIDDYALRIVGLDTVVPMKGHGELCGDRLAWLDATLSARPDQPTLVLMHHPPFLTGIDHMDAIGLTGRDEFARVVARHPQVVRILCGHLHRSIFASVGNRLALTCPSPAHQVALDLRPDGPSAFRMEPPGFMLHHWLNGQLNTHTVNVGDYAGPFPFFTPDGNLID
ncbi:MAG: phosphodiesterase [Rhizobacter sp.]